MSLREPLEKIRSAEPPPNEETAKFRILNPILQSLGWDTTGQEVELEHSVGGKDGGRVDIALYSAGKVVAFIEAKSPGTNLDNHVEQVLRYAFYGGVKICVLTTGLVWWLYLPREEGPPQERRFTVLKLMEDPLEQLMEDLSAFLSKEALLSGEAERRAKAVRQASLEAAKLNTEAPRIWEEMLNGPDKELVELLGKHVYQQLSLRPTKDQLVAILKGSVTSSIPIPTSESAEALSPKSSIQLSRVNRSPASCVIELFGQRYEFDSYRDGYREFLDILYERHRIDFHRVLELSFVASRLEQLSPTGQRNHHRQSSSGYLFDTNVSKKDMKRRADRLLKLFGYGPVEFEYIDN